jgi:hypothetical protein
LTFEPAVAHQKWNSRYGAGSVEDETMDTWKEELAGTVFGEIFGGMNLAGKR